MKSQIIIHAIGRDVVTDCFFSINENNMKGVGITLDLSKKRQIGYLEQIPYGIRKVRKEKKKRYYEKDVN